MYIQGCHGEVTTRPCSFPMSLLLAAAFLRTCTFSSFTSFSGDDCRLSCPGSVGSTSLSIICKAGQGPTRHVTYICFWRVFVSPLFMRVLHYTVFQVDEFLFSYFRPGTVSLHSALACWLLMRNQLPV